MPVFDARHQEFKPVPVAGGAGLLEKATVTLTDAQVKALPTTSIKVIDSPGAGKGVYGLAGFLQMNLVAAYTNISPTGGQLDIGLGADYAGARVLGFGTNYVPGEGDPQPTVASLSDILTRTGQTVSIGKVADDTIYHFFGSVDSPSILHVPGRANWSRADELSDLGAYLICYNGELGDFTGGDPANSLTVTVYWVVVDL